MAGLAEAQLAEDGTYPGAEGIFAAGAKIEAPAASEAASHITADFDPNQPRDPKGRWTSSGEGSSNVLPVGPAAQIENDPTGNNPERQALAGTLIDKRYDETINITHCTYHTPVGNYTHEVIGHYSCPQTSPAPRFD